MKCLWRFLFRKVLGNLPLGAGFLAKSSSQTIVLNGRPSHARPPMVAGYGQLDYGETALDIDATAIHGSGCGELRLCYWRLRKNGKVMTSFACHGRRLDYQAGFEWYYFARKVVVAFGGCERYILFLSLAYVGVG